MTGSDHNFVAGSLRESRCERSLQDGPQVLLLTGRSKDRMERIIVLGCGRKYGRTQNVRATHIFAVFSIEVEKAGVRS